MTPDELAALLRRGEDSMLEFKRDDVQNHDLARELVALLNLAGGAVLLGVDESGAIIGSTRYARNQTLVNVMRDYAYMEARGMVCATRSSPACAPTMARRPN